MDKYEREARENIPQGYFVLTASDTLKASDLCWSWTSKKWLRADSPDWIVKVYEIENLVCAIRKIEISEFEKQIPVKRVFTLRG